MPPPIFTDAYIRKVCPENHPIPLKLIKTLEPKKQPKYLANGNSGIKYVPHPISTPKRVDYIARSISREIQGKDNEKLVELHQEGINKVIGEHSKLRGGTGTDDDGGGSGMNSMNMLSALAGLGSSYLLYEYMHSQLTNNEFQPVYDEEMPPDVPNTNPFQVEPDTPPRRWPMLDPRPPPAYRTPQSDTSRTPQSDASSLPSGGGSGGRLSFGSESTRLFPSPPSASDQVRTPEEIRQMSGSEKKRQIVRLTRTKTEQRNLQINMNDNKIKKK